MRTLFYLTKHNGFILFQVISSVFPCENRFVVHSWVLHNWDLSVSFAGMYFKISMRHNPAKGKMDGYYRLVESYRNADDRVCHRTLLSVGFLDDELTIDQLNDIRRRLTGRGKSLRDGPSLFESEPSTDPVVNRFVDDFWERLVKGGRMI